MSFYFAWVADGDSTFGVEHQVEDEHVYGFELAQQEGDPATLRVVIENPRIGLLNASRDQWCWFSWRKPDNTVLPLFHGRIVAVPEDVNFKFVSVDFVARPEDYEAQKAALAEALKVAPYWDPVWVSEEDRDNPDTVLEARTALFDVDPVDKTVRLTNIINGEAGMLTFGEGDVLDETLKITYAEDPVRKVHVEATVDWDQFVEGSVNFSKKLIQAFEAAGSDRLVSTYTGEGLEKAWPKYGTDIGAGWSVGESRVQLLSGTTLDEEFITVTIDPSLLEPQIDIQEWWAESPEGYDYWYQKAVDTWIANQIDEGPDEARFYLWVFRPVFWLRYSGTRRYKEVLRFDVEADMQELTVDEEPKVLDIKVSSNWVTEPIDPDDAVPIGKASANSFFNLDRGHRSIEYLLALVRARILASARAVEISFDVPFEDAVGVTCRHNVTLDLADLPGGSAIGKVAGYRLALDGDSGEKSAGITIRSCIGKGNSLVAPTGGVPTYIEEGYVEDHQFYAGAELQPIAGEIEYTDFSVTPNDDGLDFTQMTPDNILEDTAATALFTAEGPSSAGDTITIGGRVYTFRAALTGADDVLIGGDADASMRNLADAINRNEANEGTTFGTGTVAHANVSAEANDGILRVTARVAGPGGNGINVADSADGSWDENELYDGDNGLVIHGGVTVQAAVLAETHGSVQVAIDALNAVKTEVELALKNITGGPFETTIDLEVSDLMVPKTIDLEAASV